ncbi:MAG: hypothetical protein WC915_00175 [archaeon]|jgi:hypothetical protein
MGMFFSGFDKLVLVFVIVVGLIVVVSAIDVGNSSKPFHPLQQVSVSSDSFVSVDFDVDGNIDFANMAEKVKCPNGVYDEVGNCGLGSGGTSGLPHCIVDGQIAKFDGANWVCATDENGGGVINSNTGSPLVLKVAETKIKAQRTPKNTGEFKEPWDNGNLESTDTQNSIFELNKFDDGDGLWGARCKEENDWYAKGCTMQKYNTLGASNNELNNMTIIGNGCFAQDGTIQDGYNELSISCFKIDGNVINVSGGGTILPVCNNGEYLKKNNATASGWECVTKQDIIGSREVIVRMTNLSCGTYATGKIPFFINSSDCATGANGSNTNWVLAAIIAQVGSQGNCKFDGSAADVYNNPAWYKACIDNAGGNANILCDRVCKNSYLMEYGYRQPETYNSGSYVSGSYDGAGGTISCKCIDND